ncbi:MAG: CHRD domain-containing protein [Solirubrobacteraceae bacterium]
MRRSRVKLAAAAAVLGATGFTAAAVAGGGNDFETDLNGFEEVPSVSTTGGGEVDAAVNRAGTELRYTLRYRNLEGAVQQSHIHFGQEGVNGGIVVFLCSNLGNGPAGTPECPPPPATVTDTLTADDVSAVPASAGAVTQGIGQGEFAELVRAMRAGVTYANVHSDRWPGGEIRGQFDREHDGDDDD